MVPRRGRPTQTWKTFLRNHADGIASIDLFVVPTVAFEQLFAFVVLGHGRRTLLWYAVTAHPTAEWLARQITEAFPWDSAPRYLIRDNDSAFGGAFIRRVRAMGIRDRPTSFRAPWQNGHVERFIGSIRRECIIWSWSTKSIFGGFLRNSPPITMTRALMFRSARMHRTRAPSNVSEASLHMRSSVDYIIDTHESSFRKRQFSRGDLVLHSEGGENIPSAGLTGLPILVILSQTTD
jgi:hypothetical protein